MNKMRALLLTKKEWSLTDISRRTQSLKPKERMDVLQNLILAGLVIEGERKTVTKTAKVFSSVEFMADESQED